MLAGDSISKEPVVHANCLIDLFVEFLATLNIVRGEPATDATGLQIDMETIGEVLVGGGVADEAGIELDRFTNKRAEIRDEVVRHAYAPQEHIRNTPS
jgi:hypothetical protein